MNQATTVASSQMAILKDMSVLFDPKPWRQRTEKKRIETDDFIVSR